MNGIWFLFILFTQKLYYLVPSNHASQDLMKNNTHGEPQKLIKEGP